MLNRRSFLSAAAWPAAGLLMPRAGASLKLDPAPEASAVGADEVGPPAKRAQTVQELINEALRQGHDTVVVPDHLLPYEASRVEFDPTVLLLRRGQLGGGADTAAYGATGCGEPRTDDAALAAAHQAAATHGIPLRLPAGHRYVTTLKARVSVTTPPDRPAVLRLPPDAVGAVLVIEASLVTIRHVEVDGAADEAPDGSAGIRLADVDDCRVTGCYVHDTHGPGVTMRGARNVVARNRFERCNERRGSVETEASTVDCVIAENSIRDAGHHAIRVANTGTRGVVVKSNSIVGTGGAGILQEVRAVDTVITGNTILRSGGNGVKVEDGAAAVVSDNTVRKAGANGIFVHTNPGSVITGNVISSPAHRGIAVATRAHGTSVTGNTVLQPGQEGILLADSADCIVSGNSIRGGAGDGILVRGDAYGHVITGNAALGAAGVSVRDETTGGTGQIDLNSGG